MALDVGASGREGPAVAWAVSLGSALSNDGFGFASRGEVTVAGDEVTLTARRQWPVLLKALVALVVLLSFLLPVHINAWLAAAAAWIVANLIYPRPSSITFDRADIEETTVRGRCVCVLVNTDPPTRPVMSVLCARSAAEADGIAATFKSSVGAASSERE
ncbi:MAG: hypothetical protein AB7Y46_02910 [Armatimonadota bacterium]